MHFQRLQNCFKAHWATYNLPPPTLQVATSTIRLCGRKCANKYLYLYLYCPHLPNIGAATGFGAFWMLFLQTAVRLSKSVVAAVLHFGVPLPLQRGFRRGVPPFQKHFWLLSGNGTFCCILRATFYGREERRGRGSEKMEEGQRQIYWERWWGNRFPEKCGEILNGRQLLM